MSWLWKWWIRRRSRVVLTYEEMARLDSRVREMAKIVAALEKRVHSAEYKAKLREEMYEAIHKAKERYGNNPRNFLREIERARAWADFKLQQFWEEHAETKLDQEHSGSGFGLQSSGSITQNIGFTSEPVS